MNYVLGIDQGGSQTRAALCAGDGAILSVGRSEGACHSIHGMDRAMKAVEAAAQAALARAGVRAEEIAILYGGFTGADWPDEYDLLKTNVLALEVAVEVRVANDSIIALRGGTEAAYGAALIAGSGANCAIRSPGGEQFIYHYYVGPDLQGGSALGRRALKALYRAETGREPATLLTGPVLKMCGLANVDALLRADVEQRLSVARIREIAPLVFQAAYQGDFVAGQILKDFGKGLAQMVTAGLQRFKMTNLAVEVVLSGSIFKGVGMLLQDTINANIHLVAPQARLVDARYEPVVGALLLGLEGLGITPDQTIRQNIEASSRKHRLIRAAIPEG